MRLRARLRGSELRNGLVREPNDNDLFFSRYAIVASSKSTLNSAISRLDIDDCSVNPCRNGATCLDGVDSVFCACAKGFSGPLCDADVDECLANSCNAANTERCRDDVASYACVCKSGYEGVFCDDNVDDCQGNNCRNGATCVDKLNTYECRCTVGYAGPLCDTGK